jgi:chorismate mutase / prephenate dehydratase
MKKDLSGWRKEIDLIDEKIVGLLHERALRVKKIAGAKKEAKAEVYDPAREALILKRLKAYKGAFPDDGLSAVYNEIFSVSRAMQKRLGIAYLGPVASYSNIAAVKRFGSSADYLPVAAIRDVFTEVMKGNADYGCVPIENSTEGAVNYTYDMFADFDLKIYSEVLIEINHFLLSKEKSAASVKKLFVHPQTLGQCRGYIEANLPGVSMTEVSSNSKAALLASQTKGSAAIAASLAAKIYGLNILAPSVEDVTGNMTRFFIIGKGESPRTGRDKTSVMVSIKDKVGALFLMLKPFEKYGVNLTNIESRPSRKKAWDYYFFVDMNGHIEDANVKNALAEVGKNAGAVKILGSYPKF